jgi:hypothetical protein
MLTALLLTWPFAPTPGAMGSVTLPLVTFAVPVVDGETEAHTLPVKM